MNKSGPDRRDLDTLVHRIEASHSWSDIVLSDSTLAQLREITDRVAHLHVVKGIRGLGIGVLFVGSPGGGRTMAGQIIANELRLDLFHVDLSQVVSKYIGETEKNLRRVFDAAEEVGAILFLDEADALFGRRVEVKDSHDRYVNMEVRYLLRLMESYSGLAILAVSTGKVVDPAFIRRLPFILEFPLE